MMQNEPEDPKQLGQTNRDGSTGFQADVQGGTNYFGEIHIHHASSSSSPNHAVEVHSEPPHNIHPSNTAKFVGRDRELKQLHELLQQGNVVAIADATGQGGVGKTELAVQYCWKHLMEYPGGICWLYPKHSEIEIQIAEFARVYFHNFQITEGLSPVSQARYCIKRWHPGQALLVIDNASTSEYNRIKDSLRLNTARFKILLTSREHFQGLSQILLHNLEKETCMKLAEVLLGERYLQEKANFVEELCDSIGYSPHSLHIFSGLIKKGAVVC